MTESSESPLGHFAGLGAGQLLQIWRGGVPETSASDRADALWEYWRRVANDELEFSREIFEAAFESQVAGIGNIVGELARRGRLATTPRLCVGCFNLRDDEVGIHPSLDTGVGLLREVMLHMIRRHGPSEYEVLLEFDGRTKSFIFISRVVDGVELMQYPDDFEPFFENNTAPLKPIYQAVSAFDDACKAAPVVPL